MPRGIHKSGRFRKIFVKAPGGRIAVHYRERKPSKTICGMCKKPLLGVPHQIASKLAKLPKTAKRPERPYGGMFCSACTRMVLQRKAREGGLA